MSTGASAGMMSKMTTEQFHTFVAMSLVAIPIFKGDRLYRIIGYLFIWQALTPVRLWYIDVPLMILFCLVSEILYLKIKR